MRLAVLADIHGNLAALEAALAAVKAMGIERIVIAGDVVVGGPDSAACWARVKALRCPVLRGNHERYVFDFDTPRAKPEWSGEQFGPVRWARAQFSAAERAELAALPATLRLPEAPGVLFVHGSPRTDVDLLFPYTSDEEVAEMFSGQPERLIVRGHNHYCGVRSWSGGRIVTVGSVGLPLDGTVAAQFTTLELRGAAEAAATGAEKGDGWVVAQHAVPYDVEATRRRCRETGYIEQAGPIARLYERELATAAFQIMPFLEARKRDPRLAAMTLGDAVTAFQAGL